MTWWHLALIPIWALIVSCLLTMRRVFRLMEADYKRKAKARNASSKCESCGSFVENTVAVMTAVQIIGEPDGDEFDRWEEAHTRMRNPIMKHYCTNCALTHFPHSTYYFGKAKPGSVTVEPGKPGAGT